MVELKRKDPTMRTSTKLTVLALSLAAAAVIFDYVLGSALNVVL